MTNTERMAALEARIRAAGWFKILAANIAQAARKPATPGVYWSGRR